MRRLIDRKAGVGVVAALALGAALWAGSAQAFEPEPKPVVTRHSIAIGGHALAYSAEAGRLAIRDVGTGDPVGYMFYVAYRTKPKPGQVRPITFVWNGGPGLPAASTEFEGFGPRRIDHGKMVDNADTYLTDSDLVFVDPVGTGFSRAVSLEAQKAFTSDIGDVMAATEFVRSWVLTHGAEEAPLILSGQSYGAGRAGSAAYQLLKRGMKVRGLALVSNTSGLPRYTDQALIAPAMHVGDYAVAALYFKKLPPDFGTTPEAARAKAEAWARETYIPALRRADQMSEAERTALRAELARHIGLTTDDIDPKTLGLTQGHFLGHIMPGERLYYSDYREHAPYKAPPLDLGVKSIRHELGYDSDLIYLDVEPVENGFAPDGTYPKSVNASWTHATVYGATAAQIAEAEAAFSKTGAIGMAHFGPNLPGAAEAIQLDPKLKVMVAHAAYDPLGGCSMDAELGRHLTSPYREAVQFHCYMAGHAIYRDAPARAELAHDMRAMAHEISRESR